MRSKLLALFLVFTASLSIASTTPAATAAELVVEVLDSNGAPIAGAVVNAAGEKYARQTQTDKAGYAFFRKVPRVVLDVTVEFEGLSHENAVVDMYQNNSVELKVVLIRLVGLDELMDM